MANIYVRSTTGSDENSGAGWSAAKATLAGAVSIAAPGDTIFLSQSHAEYFGATGYTFISPGTVGSPIRIVGVSDTAEPPTTLAVTKPILNATTGSIIFKGSVELENIDVSVGSGASVNSLGLSIFDSTTGVGVARHSRLKLSHLAGGRPIAFGVSLGRGSLGIFNECEFSLGGTAGMLQALNFTKGRYEFNDCWLSAGMNKPLYLLSVGSDQYGPVDVLFSGFDCSTMPSDFALLRSGLNINMFIIFRNSKFPASWTESIFHTSDVPTGSVVEFHNCTAGSALIKYLRQDNAGVIRNHDTHVRTGGSNDGANYSLRYNTNANASNVNALIGPELPAPYISTVGVPVTATLEVLIDSATALTDDDVWIEGVYLANAGDTLAKVASGRKPILAAATTLPTSTATWDTTGMTSPQKRKLQVTFTPARKGFLHLRVAVAKKSITLYADNKIGVA